MNNKAIGTSDMKYFPLSSLVQCTNASIYYILEELTQYYHFKGFIVISDKKYFHEGMVVIEDYKEENFSEGITNLILKKIKAINTDNKIIANNLYDVHEHFEIIYTNILYYKDEFINKCQELNVPLLKEPSAEVLKIPFTLDYTKENEKLENDISKLNVQVKDYEKEIKKLKSIIELNSIIKSESFPKRLTLALEAFQHFYDDETQCAPKGELVQEWLITKSKEMGLYHPDQKKQNGLSIKQKEVISSIIKPDKFL